MSSSIVRYANILLVVALYWCVSITTIFINKTLLSELQLDAPIFVTWYQCLVSAIICYTLCQLSQRYPKTISFPYGEPFNVTNMRNMVPLTSTFILMLSFNNLCLKNVGVAFYYVSRSLTTVFNVILTYVILKERTSPLAIFSCVVIFIGFSLGVNQEGVAGSFSTLGTVFGVISSFAQALFSIHTKEVLPYVNDKIWLVSYYNNVYAVVLFIPIVYLCGEFTELSSYPHLFSFYFWVFLTIGGLFGLTVGYVTSLQIQVTSPLTHNISGTAKASFHTVLATYLYHEVKPVLWWISNAIILSGSAIYAFVKKKELDRRKDMEELM
uniref:GDP-fucose transporter 1 n=1 Tax=Cacopsylla melanoneura TaxID=428564 RepID=A0A8D8TJV5_9HEMI